MAEQEHHALQELQLRLQQLLMPANDYLVHGRVHRAGRGESLRVPARAVVVPGSRPAPGEYAKRNGIQLQTPVIVKYRDPGTDAALTLEQALR